MILLDWPDEETVGVQDQQKLWDEDWDDDDVEDNFAQQLKYVLFFHWYFLKNTRLIQMC